VRREVPDFELLVVGVVILAGFALERLREGCREATRAPTLEAMTSHFADGVVDALRSLGRGLPRVSDGPGC
jgi:hypothetical protein